MAIESGDEFELEGFWQIPIDRTTIEAHGYLRYHPDRGALLEVGATSDHPALALGGSEQVPVLQGVTIDGTPCSLINPINVHTSGKLFTGAARMEWHSTAFTYGAQIKSLGELEVRRVLVTWKGLTEWIRNPARPGVGLAPSDEPVRVEIDGGELVIRYRLEGTRAEMRTDERFVGVAEVSFTSPRRWEDVYGGFLGPLRDLVLFGTGAPSPLLSLCIADVEKGDGGVVRVGADQTIELVLEDVSRPLREGRTDPYQKQLMPFAVWRDDPGELVARWLTLHARLGSAGELLFANLLRQAPFIENRCFNAVGFAEAYHRISCPATAIPQVEHESAVEVMVNALRSTRLKDHYGPRLTRANEFGLRARLKALFRRAEDVLEVVQKWRRDGLPDKLCVTRNAIAHEAGAGKPLEGWDLYLATVRLHVVLEINLMLDLGLAPNVIASLVNHRYINRVGVLTE